ncbi:hypothetical protein E2F43_15235 [Seongchinamella unica]|uniref:Uncharacterized protein n=1 Tax=Seongchinamella unica TaxID=2547392 RepID=A0A4R5LQR0_9GAMM|nr:hypothetical protein [Seongchinamella unica]TDG12907.1 hypothetical protein E2F43_15235 [Seongchinamella unica]
MIETFVLAAALAAGIVLFLRLFAHKRQPRVRSAPVYQASSHYKQVKPAARSQYRAVSCSGPCPAVRNLDGKRFLEREAPSLPLPGCTAARCDCVYVHHEDRRSGRKDRRGLSQIEREFFDHSGKPNRRMRRGRRASDLAVA